MSKKTKESSETSPSLESAKKALAELQRSEHTGPKDTLLLFLASQHKALAEAPEEGHAE